MFVFYWNSWISFRPTKSINFLLCLFSSCFFPKPSSPHFLETQRTRSASLLSFQSACFPIFQLHIWFIADIFKFYFSNANINDFVFKKFSYAIAYLHLFYARSFFCIMSRTEFYEGFFPLILSLILSINMQRTEFQSPLLICSIHFSWMSITVVW